jgi:hypothetical protein
MFWDPDIYPQGLVERIDFDKLFGWNSGGKPVTYSKEGKAPPPPPAKRKSAFELSLIAGQFIFYDNAESQFDSDLHTDSYLFEEQFWPGTEPISSRLPLGRRCSPRMLALMAMTRACLRPRTILSCSPMVSVKNATFSLYWRRATLRLSRAASR